MNLENRSFRDLEMRIRQQPDGEDGESYAVEGYASTFEPYVLFSSDGIDYSEKIDRHAFDNADMSDVVFRIDHEGPVYARTSAGDLALEVDDHGLHTEIDLGRSSGAKTIFEDIAAGHYPKMSFAFHVNKAAYDEKKHLRTVLEIDKVYDVSAVSFPANPGTELDVATRSFFDGVIEKERAERLAAETRSREAKRLKLRIKLMEEKHEYKRNER